MHLLRLEKEFVYYVTNYNQETKDNTHKEKSNI